MTNLATRYLGLDLRSPVVASGSPLSGTVDGVRRLADSGVGAVVLPSLFQEQVRQQAARDAAAAGAGADSVAEALSYLPAAASADGGPYRYLSLLERAATAVDIPVIASLNGATTGGWTDYASSLQDAGAAAIELNVYYLPGSPPPPVGMPRSSSLAPFSGSEVEQRHVEILTTVKAVVSVPVAVKLSPYFSSTGAVAHRLDQAGADGLVLFNRFLQPDIDPETLTVTVRPGLSAQEEGRLPRTWIALLAGRVFASLAASTGVETAADVAKYLLAGADVVMTASALLRHGPGYASVMLDELSGWMARKGFRNVGELRGLLSVPAGTDEAAYERAGYVTALDAANHGYGPW